MTCRPPRLSLFPAEVGIVEITVAAARRLPGRACARSPSTCRARTTRPSSPSPRSPSTSAPARARRCASIRSRSPGATRRRSPSSSPTRATPRCRRGPTASTPRTSSRSGSSRRPSCSRPAAARSCSADVRGGRPWFGQPKPRVLTFSLGADSPPAMATFVQRPRIGRWLISLLGLVTVGGDLRPRAQHGRRPARRRVRGRRRAARPGADPAGDRRRRDRVGHAEHGQRHGRRRRAPARASPACRPTCTRAGNGAVPVATRGHRRPPARSRSAGCRPGATGCAFTGAGFAEQWYQGSIDVRRRHRHRGRRRAKPWSSSRSSSAGGRAASRARWWSADPTGAVARLVVPGVADPDANALVDEVTVSADGSFLFEEVPSPANYQLIVDKAGFATEVARRRARRRPGARGDRGRAARGRRRRLRARAEPGRAARRGRRSWRPTAPSRSRRSA